ncbi:MAG: Maleylpyruvate isomerase [Alphaproteobacteria bacterium MarineAlpha9_Bin3]|nr:MAG: Maleylpyruvate isomerase [Alphaproteobacteria bacterium MarineAlpha9_Bin3]
MIEKPILYNYFRSSTSVRVRIALNLKDIDYNYVPLHLRKEEHKKNEYLQINPYGLLPTLKFPSGIILNQSLAILEYLDEVYPTPSILPLNPIEKAKVRSMAYAIALEIHPLNNLHVLNYLKDDFMANEEKIKSWFSRWVHKAFEPFEKVLESDTESGSYCFGDTPTIADICLFSQVVNNTRFGIDLSKYPRINNIYENCLKNNSFIKALPKYQPDAE